MLTGEHGEATPDRERTMGDGKGGEESMASKGGKASAAKLTPAERSQRAKLAAAGRWGGVPLAAVCGSADRPLVIAGHHIQAYVLEDGTRILTQGDFQEAIGRHRKASVRYQEEGEERTPPILQGVLLKPFISKELLKKSVPIKFMTPDGSVASGYRAEILPEVCEVFLKARDAGVLQKQQEHIAARADILIRGLAQVGIIALVDEATGYQERRQHDELTRILQEFVAKEIRDWVPTFDTDFYKMIFRLKGWSYTGTTKRPRILGQITNDLVYKRLAPGLLAELQRINPKDDRGNRKSRHHQWLTEHRGHPGIIKHLGRLTGWGEMAGSWEALMRHVNEKMPVYGGPTLFDETVDE